MTDQLIPKPWRCPECGTGKSSIISTGTWTTDDLLPAYCHDCHCEWKMEIDGSVRPEHTADQSPFDAPDIMSGYPLDKKEQEHVDRIVRKETK